MPIWGGKTDDFPSSAPEHDSLVCGGGIDTVKLDDLYCQPLSFTKSDFP